MARATGGKSSASRTAHASMTAREFQVVPRGMRGSRGRSTSFDDVDVLRRIAARAHRPEHLNRSVGRCRRRRRPRTGRDTTRLAARRGQRGLLGMPGVGLLDCDDVEHARAARFSTDALYAVNPALLASPTCPPVSPIRSAQGAPRHPLHPEQTACIIAPPAPQVIVRCRVGKTT